MKPTPTPTPTPMSDDAALDAMQAALTELLARELPPAETLRVLAEDPAFAAHRAWVTAFTPALTEAASALSAYWARRG